MIDLWLRYLKKNGIGGVGMRAKVFEFVEFGFGRLEVENLESQFESGGEKEIEDAAKELIKQLSGPIGESEMVKLMDETNVDAGPEEKVDMAESQSNGVDQVEEISETAEDRSKAGTESATMESSPSESTLEQSTTSQESAQPHPTSSPMSSIDAQTSTTTPVSPEIQTASQERSNISPGAAQLDSGIPSETSSEFTSTEATSSTSADPTSTSTSTDTSSNDSQAIEASLSEPLSASQEPVLRSYLSLHIDRVSVVHSTKSLGNADDAK